jgi:Trk-type K+ transport system membrane component
MKKYFSIRYVKENILIIIVGIILGGIFFFVFYSIKNDETEKEISKYENEIFSSFLEQ